MANTRENNLQISQLLEDSYAVMQIDMDQMATLAQQALALSEPYSLDYARASVLLSIYLTKEESYQAGIEGLLEAIALFKGHEDKWLLVAYYNLGVSYHQLNLFTEATQAHQKQYDIAKRLGSNIWMASALRRMGADQDHLGQPERALEYYDRSLKLYLETDSPSGAAGVYNNMSIAHYVLGNYEQALQYARMGLPLFEQINHMGGLTQIHGNIALAASALGLFDEALTHANKNLQCAENRGYSGGIVLAYLRLSKIYRDMDNPDASIDSLNRALDLVDNIDPHSAIEAHYEAFKHYEQSGELGKALTHHQQYHALKVAQLEEAMTSRFETLAIIHQTQRAQEEAELQRDLREKDRHYFEKLNTMKDELVSTASHDLKNPLASIMTILYLLNRHGNISDQYGKELLERMRSSVMQMRDLITNVLDLARLETGKSLTPTTTDVSNLLQQIADEYRLLANSKGVHFHFSNIEKRHYLPVDVLMLRRVFANLLSNALKFTPEGGEISLDAESNENSVVITITDTGIGIPSADQPHIFDRFYRVNHTRHQEIEGTGLGLSICKTIVEQHHGTIEVDSTENVGTRFTIHLPIVIGE